MDWLRTLPDGRLLLTLHVQPRAGKEQLAGLHGEALKIRLTSPPVEGRANKAVIALLAKLLHLPKSAVVIKSGLQSRSKQVLISGCDEKTARQSLLGEGGPAHKIKRNHKI
ncbi:MAG: YggU family protein [Deltaproteobacteria bacterium]|nr:YggU family protein [Deltaproteobacteria bacterium]